MLRQNTFLMIGLLFSSASIAGSFSYSPVELDIYNTRNCTIHIKWHHGSNAMIKAPNGWNIASGSTGHFIVQQTGGEERSNFQVTFVAYCEGEAKEIASIRVENEARGTSQNLAKTETYTVTRATNLVAWWPTSAIKALDYNHNQICSAAWRSLSGMCVMSRHQVHIGNN